MKITAKLAISQLKNNPVRTVWTSIAVLLATALTTAVCSFVVSGNAMIIDFLGEDYGEYAGTYRSMLFVPAVLFGILIIAMSIIVISNVFRISAGERVAQFGVLRCMGATGRQIAESVMYESIFLSIVNIPLGLVVGIVLAFAGVNVANYYLDDLNALTNIMIREIHLHVPYVISARALLLSGFISLGSVLGSAYGPAKRASKSSAMENVRRNQDVKIKKDNMFINKLIQKIFGYEGILALKNLKRNRRNFRATCIALSAGSILWISLTALSSQAQKMEALMQPDIDETVIAEYMSARERVVNGKTGQDESIYLKPIDSDLGNMVTNKLEQYDHEKIFGMGMDSETYHASIIPVNMTTEMIQSLKKQDIDSERLTVEIITLDDSNYETLCEKAKVPLGSNILINHYSYNNQGIEEDMIPYTSTLTTLSLAKADGNMTDITINGMLTLEETPRELIYFNPNPIRIIVPQAMVRVYSWYSSPENIEDYIAYANDVLAQVFPHQEDATYMDAGFNVRVYKLVDYMKVMNIAIMLVLVFMYSFVMILMLIGFTNVISTLTTNVLMRSKEFAVLRSVGMTPEGLRKMLNFESIFCALKALVIGIPIGIAMSYFINKPIRSMFPIPYQLPWLPALLCVVIIVLVTCSTTGIALKKLTTQNIIEAIRSN